MKFIWYHLFYLAQSHPIQYSCPLIDIYPCHDFLIIIYLINDPATQAERGPLTNAIPPKGKIHPFSKTA